MFHNWLEGGTALYSRGGHRLAAVPAITFLRARGEPPEKMAVQAAFRAYPLLIESRAGSKLLLYRASLPENRFTLFRTHSRQVLAAS